MGRPFFGTPDSSSTHPSSCSCPACVTSAPAASSSTPVAPTTVDPAQPDALVREQSQGTTDSLRRVSVALEDAYTRLRAIRESLEALSDHIMAPPLASPRLSAPPGMAPTHNAIVLSSELEREHGVIVPTEPQRGTERYLRGDASPPLGSSAGDSSTTFDSREVVRLVRARARMVLDLINHEYDPNDSSTTRGRRVNLRERIATESSRVNPPASIRAESSTPAVSPPNTSVPQQVSGNLRRRVLAQLSAGDVSAPEITSDNHRRQEAPLSQSLEGQGDGPRGSSPSDSPRGGPVSRESSWDDRTRRIMTLAQRLRGAMPPPSEPAGNAATRTQAPESREAAADGLYRIRRRFNTDGVEIIHRIQVADGVFLWREREADNTRSAHGEDEPVPLLEARTLLFEGGTRTPITLDEYRAVRARRRAAAPTTETLHEDEHQSEPDTIVFGSNVPFVPSPLPMPLEYMVPTPILRKRAHEDDTGEKIVRRPFIQR